MTAIPPEKAPKPGLNIYGCASVNPVKLTIAAEELSVTYNYVCLDMPSGETKAKWYTSSINPNGRMPAIVHVKEDGTSVTVFESGPCLLYMANEFDKKHELSYPFGTPEYWTQLSWLSWQLSGYGPMIGQAVYYIRYATETAPHGIWRYSSECRRLNHVLEKQLSKFPYVAGDRLTVTDIAIFIFTHSLMWGGIDINAYPHVKTWHDKLAQRPAFQKGLQVPVPYQFSDEAVSNPDNQETYKMIREFGGKAIKSWIDQWPGDVLPVPSDYANLDQ